MAFSRLTGQDASNTSAAATVVATYPTTPTQNNLLIAVVYSDDGGAAITGWTVATSSLFFLSSGGVYILYKVAGVAESTTVTATSSGLGSSMTIAIFEYSGNATSSPLDKVNSNNSGASNVTSISTNGLPFATVPYELAISVAFWTLARTSPSWSNSFNNIATIVGMIIGEKITVQPEAFITTGSATGTAQRSVAAIASFKAIPVNQPTITFT